MQRAKPLIILCADTHTKQRLLERCFSSDAAKVHEVAIKGITSRPTEWRFSSIIPALQQLQFAETGLRNHWNLAKYKNRPGDDRNQPTAMDVDAEAQPAKPKQDDTGDVGESDL
eukprot:8597883-Pyramimonas_sp.AAC.1